MSLRLLRNIHYLKRDKVSPVKLGVVIRNVAISVALPCVREVAALFLYIIRSTEVLFLGLSKTSGAFVLGTFLHIICFRNYTLRWRFCYAPTALMSFRLHLYVRLSF